MALVSHVLNRLILVVDEELSTYKGILRICQSQNIEVLHFACQQALINWFNDNKTRINSGSVACCMVIEPNFVDVFDDKTLNDSFLICPKICISRSGSSETLLQSSKIRVFEFVSKPFRLEKMRETLEHAFLSYQQGAQVHNRFRNLTNRELQTCSLLAEGNPNKDIADKLGISIKTVKVHRANLMRKIEVKSIADLLRAYDAFHALSSNSELPTVQLNSR